MKTKITSFFLFLFSFLAPLLSIAQEEQGPVEMADKFRAEGKIYVVVTVVAIILIGIFTTLFILERRIKKLEKESK